MKCAFCGRAIADQPDSEREHCGACSGGCRKIHCPWCGYANPMVPKFLRKLLKNDDKE